jgi:protein SCO1/2
MTRPQLLAFVLFMISLPLVAAGAGGQTAPAQNSVLRGVGIDQQLNAQVPLNLMFTDENNTKIHLSDLCRGKPIVLVLVQYNCPNLCTAILNDMLSTLKVIPQNIGSDYDVWTVSFDPSENAALAMAKKNGYVRTYQRTRPEARLAASGWHFLTGDAGAIHSLTQSVGFHYRRDPITQQFIHPAALILLTPEGKISRYFFGIEYDPTDLRLSLVEASHGKIGSLTDEILLFCYHYDPATGRYGLAILNALEAGAALTLLLLVGGIYLLWRIDRRRTRKLMPLTREQSPLPDKGAAT